MLLNPFLITLLCKSITLFVFGKSYSNSVIPLTVPLFSLLDGGGGLNVGDFGLIDPSFGFVGFRLFPSPFVGPLGGLLLPAGPSG